MSDEQNLLERWLDSQGMRFSRIQRLVGGASPRLYWRIFDDGGSSQVVVQMPQGAGGPTEAGATSCSEERWLLLRTWLAEVDLPVPGIYTADLAAGFLAVEDLGDTRLFDDVTRSPEEREAKYQAAIDLLVNFQQRLAGLLPPGTPTFSREHVIAEVDEFSSMGLEHRLQIQLSKAERELMASVGRELARELKPELLAHRDFQSQNLMQTPRGLVIIDFQDAFLAPRTYDLVALLRDSYVVLSLDEVKRLLARFASASHMSLSCLEDAFHLQTIQRKLKDAGRFETLARRGKAGFLAYFPDSIAYVVHALQASGRFPDLLDLLCTHLPEARSAII